MDTKEKLQDCDIRPRSTPTPELTSEIKTETGNYTNQSACNHMESLLGLAHNEITKIGKPPAIVQRQLPVVEMRRLMDMYGPETNASYSRKSTTVKLKYEHSVRRKFSRWFPDFHSHFTYDPVTDMFHPRYGVEYEMQRRQEKREKHARKLRYSRLSTSNKEGKRAAHRSSSGSSKSSK